jgi:hypothetical protein
VKIVLVYQGGIANVFEVDCFNLSGYGRNAKRLHQGSFESAKWVAHGLGLAGAIVRSAHCNWAGDISESHWSENLEDAPFSPIEVKMN